MPQKRTSYVGKTRWQESTHKLWKQKYSFSLETIVRHPKKFIHLYQIPFIFYSFDFIFVSLPNLVKKSISSWTDFLLRYAWFIWLIYGVMCCHRGHLLFSLRIHRKTKKKRWMRWFSSRGALLRGNLGAIHKVRTHNFQDFWPPPLYAIFVSSIY